LKQGEINVGGKVSDVIHLLNLGLEEVITIIFQTILSLLLLF